MTVITHPWTLIIPINWTVYIYWVHTTMMVRWMMFGEAFVQIGCSCLPKHVVVALADYILYQIEPHIHCFGTFFLDDVIFYPLCGWFICMRGHYLLWVSHFLKCDSDWFPCFGFVEQCPRFCLHFLWHYIFHDVGECEYLPIGFSGVVKILIS